ncbi:tyrosinase family protein [Actinomycetospora sp. CA-101289]|uniref:tyrosinase family protein n=1 Tax=Actinomycetospora sp. CA-101289 TaxID=3239893 RepID=UPI003D977E51
MADGMVVRPRIENADIPALRSAYERMQQFSATDNRGWMYWAGIHGFPRFSCWHHGRLVRTQFPYNLFLPWHRAYLLYFESVARDSDDQAITPWWDWSSPESHQNGIPDSYAEPQVAGDRNPLASAPTSVPGVPNGLTRRFPGPPDRLPRPDEVERVLRLRSFVDFTSQVEDLHDRIHGWVGGVDPNNPTDGGDMGSIARSAFDPIFWAHHCMIDRLWYLWQLRHGEDNIPAEYLSRPLGPFSLTVRDVLHVNNLGYDYVAAQAVVPMGG